MRVEKAGRILGLMKRLKIPDSGNEIANLVQLF
jgi:hypothetical protein